MRKDKETARAEWLAMIQQSWTWAKLTKEEQERFMELLMGLESRIDNPIKGDYDSRWSVLEALYEMFLEGLGYKPIGWRE